MLLHVGNRPRVYTITTIHTPNKNMSTHHLLQQKCSIVWRLSQPHAIVSLRVYNSWKASLATLKSRRLKHKSCTRDFPVTVATIKYRFVLVCSSLRALLRVRGQSFGSGSGEAACSSPSSCPLFGRIDKWPPGEPGEGKLW